MQQCNHPVPVPASGSLTQIAERFLAAGKAVVSEKPVAATVEAARAAIARYRAGPPAGGRSPVWMLAENYRWVG